MSSDEISTTAEYREWVVDLKTRFRSVQLKAAVSVNTELLTFYWELGADIVAKQADQAWGSGFINQLSHDLMHEFPEVKGFSVRNLAAIRQWFEFWRAAPATEAPIREARQDPRAIVQQPVAQLAGQPPRQLMTIRGATTWRSSPSAKTPSRPSSTSRLRCGTGGAGRSSSTRSSPTCGAAKVRPRPTSPLPFHLRTRHWPRRC